MIELRGVHKSFDGRPVLCGVDLTIMRGEILYIIGTSGVGKSVTVKHLVGLLRIDSGEIWFDGVRIDQLGEREFLAIRKRMVLVLQSPALFDSMTLAENVALPLRVHRRSKERAALDAARECLGRVHLGDQADRYPAELSEGVRKRAAVARALALDPEVVLLDEPTTGLDPVSARRVDRLITELCRDMGKTAVVVSHDLASIFGVADRVAFLYQGRVHALGTAQDFRLSSDPVVQQFIRGQSTGPMETPGF